MTAAPISGAALPKLRKRVEADLAEAARWAATPWSRRSSGCSTPASIRVGNEAYAQANKSFGATTLRNRHAKVRGAQAVKMRLQGKSGIERELTITDAHGSRGSSRRCQDLPGQHLFQYVDEEGEPQPVTSTDVNDYIREATGEDFTAKHFRTWSASVIAFEQICARRRGGRRPEGDARAGRRSARQHARDQPQILCPSGPDRGGQGRRPANGSALQCPRATKYLSGAERGLIAFLERKPRAQERRRQPDAPIERTSASARSRPGPARCGRMSPPGCRATTSRSSLAAASPARDRRAVLLGMRWLGARICGTDPDHTHWRTIIGRVLAGTSLWFMVAVAAELVAGYAQAPRAVAATIARLLHRRRRRCRWRSGRARSSSA